MKGTFELLQQTLRLLRKVNKELNCIDSNVPFSTTTTTSTTTIQPTTSTTTTIEPTTTTSTTTINPECDSCWTTVNFSGTTFNNGDPIPQALNQTDWNNANIAGTPIWAYYDYDPSYGPIYGKLYNWHVVNDPRGIAPTGYHVPTRTEWNSLIACLGGELVAAGKMKTTGTLEGGTGLWLAPNTGATNNMEGCNECPFSALPGSGIREYGEPQTDINRSTVFWASTQSNSTDAWSVELYNNDAAIYPATTTKTVGNSIRFKKDTC